MYKTFITILLLVMIPFLSISQKVLKENENLYYGYTAEENKIIAIFILEHDMKDTIIKQQSNIINNFYTLEQLYTTKINISDSISTMLMTSNSYLQSEYKKEVKAHRTTRIRNAILLTIETIINYTYSKMIDIFEVEK